MTLFDQLKKQIKDLDDDVRLQRSTRIGIRALWMGLAGILLAWLAHTLWGWLPNPVTWFAVGLAVALVPLTAVLVVLFPVVTDLLPSREWIDALDARLRLREQLSTAWEVADEPGRTDANQPVSQLLVADMLALMPRAREELLKGGWFRKLDAALVGLLSLLLIAALALTLFQPANPQTGAQTPVIPQTGQQQPDSSSGSQSSNGSGSQSNGSQGAQNGQQQNGQPQDGGSAANGSGNNSSGTDNQQGNANSPGANQDPNQNGNSASGMDSSAVANALKQLGDKLSQQAGTYDLGQALKNLDLNNAAKSLQQLGGQLDNLSPESRQKLSDALGSAAQDLNNAQAPGVAQDAQNASGAAGDPNTPPDAANQAFGQLAQDLGQLGNALNSGQNGQAGNAPGAGLGQNGTNAQGAPVDRLPGGSGQMDLPQGNADNSGLLSPAQPDAAGSGTASGSLDAANPQPQNSSGSPLLPNSLLWKWRDVVSQYFQHQSAR